MVYIGKHKERDLCQKGEESKVAYWIFRQQRQSDGSKSAARDPSPKPKFERVSVSAGQNFRRDEQMQPSAAAVLLEDTDHHKQMQGSR